MSRPSYFLSLRVAIPARLLTCLPRIDTAPMRPPMLVGRAPIEFIRLGMTPTTRPLVIDFAGRPVNAGPRLPLRAMLYLLLQNDVEQIGQRTVFGLVGSFTDATHDALDDVLRGIQLDSLRTTVDRQSDDRPRRCRQVLLEDPVRGLLGRLVGVDCTLQRTVCRVERVDLFLTPVRIVFAAHGILLMHT